MGAARRTIVWLAPGQVPLVREVAKAAELSIVGVGGPERGRAAEMAEALAAAALSGAGRDDLRAALATADADLFWIVDPGTGEEGEADAAALRAAAARGVRIATLEPIPGAASALADAGWSGDPQPAPIDCVRVVPGFLDSTPLRQGEELLAALGPPRLIAIELWSGPGEGSLAAKLYAAMDAVRRLVGDPETVDAAYVGPRRGPSVHAAPGESLRGLRGDMAMSLRFADGRAGTLTLSDQTAGWERSVTLAGPGGRMRVTDDAVHWVDAEGRAQDEAGASPARKRKAPASPAAAAIVKGLAGVFGTAGPARGAAQSLALCHAALLSCRTGQAESPATIRRIAGLE